MKLLLKVAVEAMVTVSLIALVSLLLALVYGLLMLLSPEPSPAISQNLIGVERVYLIAKASPIATKPSYEQMTSRELRKICKDRHVPKWNKLTKSQMVAALSA